MSKHRTNRTRALKPLCHKALNVYGVKSATVHSVHERLEWHVGVFHLYIILVPLLFCLFVLRDPDGVVRDALDPAGQPVVFVPVTVVFRQQISLPLSPIQERTGGVSVVL